jgi:hypothetical protein
VYDRVPPTFAIGSDSRARLAGISVNTFRPAAGDYCGDDPCGPRLISGIKIAHIAADRCVALMGKPRGASGVHSTNSNCPTSTG